MRRAPGKPNKNRNKSNDEPIPKTRLPKRHQSTGKCRKCGTLGNNVRTCKGKTAVDRVIPKVGNKKRKKNP